MMGMEIVREEWTRMLRGTVPLTLIAYGVFALAGYGGVPTVTGLLLGACYSLFLFWLIAKNAAKALLFSPEQGTKVVRRGYVFRYVMTGVLIVCAIKAPFINPLAAVLPLFFPKIVLLLSSLFQRKGG